jgi:hypothetical protein
VLESLASKLPEDALPPDFEEAEVDPFKLVLDPIEAEYDPDAEASPEVELSEKPIGEAVAMTITHRNRIGTKSFILIIFQKN